MVSENYYSNSPRYNYVIKHDEEDNIEEHAAVQEALDNGKIGSEYLVWQVKVVSDQFIKMTSSKQMFGVKQPQRNVGLNSKDHLFRELKAKLHERLDSSPLRSCLQLGKWEDFAKSHEDLRKDFMNGFHDAEIKTHKHLHAKLKRDFDWQFLRLSNMKAPNTEPYFILYDNWRKKICFAEIRHVGGRFYYDYLPTTNAHLQLAVRRNWIKYQCLYGQDDEFNVFRSICFADSMSKDQRCQIGIIALTLQILMCVGITMDCLEKWLDFSPKKFLESMRSFEYADDYILIVIISILTLTFILQRLRRTVESFQQFYTNMDEVFIIRRMPTSVITMDFIANIVVGTWMALLTPFFLLQSGDIQPVVLNSFALTFFLELDDMANIFDFRIGRS